MMSSIWGSHNEDKVVCCKSIINTLDPKLFRSYLR